MSDEMWVNMGPQHPFNHGLWNLRVKLNGETITDAEPIIGYLHRGWEKMVENRTYSQIVPLADRLCYGSSLSWNHLYCLTAEKVYGIEAPDAGLVHPSGRLGTAAHRLPSLLADGHRY